MDVVFGLLLLVALGAVIVVVVRFAWRVLVGIWRLGTTPTHQQPGASQPSAVMSAEEEGNVHSGPYGYSPNTAYPETQYGSGFDPEAEWNHEEQ